MSTNLDAARFLYRTTLEEIFGEKALEHAATALGLELDGDDHDQPAMVERIVTRIEEPGVLQDALGDHSEGSLELLVRLLDVGELHPPSTLRMGLHGESPEEMASLLALLQRLGLFVVRAWRDNGFVMIQPIARELLGDELEAFRQQRWNDAASASEVIPVPLHQTLALCANFLRRSDVRLTSKGEIYQRDLKKATALFAPLAARTKGTVFSLATTLLDRLGCLSFAGNLVRVEPRRAQEVLDGIHDPGVDILGRDRWDLPLALSLLDFLAERQQEHGDGWTPTSHLMVHGELFLAASSHTSGVGQFRFGFVEGRVLERLMELRMLSLVLSNDREHPRTSFRITPAGVRIVELGRGEVTTALDSKPTAGENDGARAVFQANLDVLVPLEAPAWIHWRVGAVAELVSIDSMCTYSIGKEHAQCVFGREGADPEEWVNALSDCAAHELPENVLESLRSWLRNQASVTVRNGTVVVLDEDAGDAGRTAFEDAARKLRAHRVAPGVFVIDASVRQSRALSVLQHFGLRIENGDSNEDDGDGKADEIDSGRADDMPQSAAALDRLLSEYLDAKKDLAALRSAMNASAWFDEAAVIATIDGDGPAKIEGTTPGAAPEAKTFGPWVSTGISALIHTAVRLDFAVEIVLERENVEQSWPLFPEAVLKRGSRVYVNGFCPETEELRAFPLDEIIKARVVTRNAEDAL